MDQFCHLKSILFRRDETRFDIKMYSVFSGRLQVSSIDGKSPFGERKYVHFEAFGGRGYSIWDSSNPSSPQFDSDGTLEQYMEAFDKKVFNTDYVSNMYYESPEQLRDYSSYKQVE